MNKTIRFLLNIFASLILCIVIGVLLLWVVYLLPSEPMETHMQSTADVFEEEGIYPQFPVWCYSVLDNWTDGTMIGSAIYEGSCSPLIESMAVARNQYATASPNDSIVNHYVYGIEEHYTDGYPNYWHGYLVILKPLLMITNYTGIRIINACCQTLLFAILLWLMYKGSMKKYIAAFALSLCCIRLLASFCCLGFSTNYYIFMMGCIAIMLLRRRDAELRRYLYLFWALGIATGYFALLAFPIVNFGIPFILFFAGRQFRSFKEAFLTLLKTGILWAFGYALMWGAKWVVGTVITGDNYILSAIEKILSNSDDDLHFTYLQVVYGTLRDFSLSPFVVGSVGYAVYLAFCIIRNRHGMQEHKKELITSAVILGLVALIPFAYIMVLKRHVGIHHGIFEFKIFTITVMAGLFMLVKIKNLASSGEIKENI